MATPILPKEASPVVDGAARPTREWFNFFRDLLDVAASADSDAAAIAALQAAVAELQEGVSGFTLAGPLTVEVSGTPSNGFVAVSLRNDEATPAATHYYGTDDLGVLGYHFRTYRGVLPMVTGELVSDQPVFLVGADGSLIYGPVEY